MTGITIGGETFNVQIEGGESKTALMLSHPLGTNLDFWDPQIPALLQHFRVVRYDSRGHGTTTADHGPYSIEGFGRDALAILDQLGIEKVHWLGLSMGSAVGLWLLVNARERIGRAVLAGAAAQFAGPDLWNSRIQSARETGMSGAAAAAAERWFSKSFRDAEPAKVERVLAMVRATPLNGYLAACAALRDMDLREAIRSVTNKVLVITGRHDTSTPPGMGALVASSIEGAQLVTLEAPHLSNIEGEAHFTKAVVDFLTAPETAITKAPLRRKAAAKPAKKAAVKAPARKAAAKKAAAKKRAAKKAAGRRVLARKASAKKTSARKLKAKAPTKKAAAKKPARKAVAKKKSRLTKRVVSRRRG